MVFPTLKCGATNPRIWCTQPYNVVYPTLECGVPGRQRQHIGALNLGAAQQHLVQDLVLQQPHGSPPLTHVPPLLDGVGHVSVPPAVVLQRSMPACTRPGLQTYRTRGYYGSTVLFTAIVGVIVIGGRSIMIVVVFFRVTVEQRRHS